MLASPVTIQARQILDIVYPVGMVLMFNDGTNPNNIMHGQTWTKLPGGYALTTTNNTNGGNVSLTDAQNHKPGYSYQGGLPNIEGSFKVKGAGTSGSRPWYDGEAGDISGAFGVMHPDSSKNYISSASGKGSASEIAESFTFDASNSSDRYGAYQGSKASVVADHYAVVAWKRTG